MHGGVYSPTPVKPWLSAQATIVLLPLTIFSFPQPAKASSWMVVTLLGIWTSTRFLQFAKA